MIPLNKGNSTIDPNSGAIIFNGSPELRAICELQQTLKAINNKLDVLITLIAKGGITDGGKMESSRFSQNNDPKI